MTHEEMASVLRAAGWTAEPPPDLRVAGLWEPQGPSSFGRMWRGTTAIAARVWVDAGCYPPRRCSCAPQWAWAARLYGERGHFCAEGQEATQAAAQARADAALLRKLREAREARLAGQRPCLPTEDLSLPEEG